MGAAPRSSHRVSLREALAACVAYAAAAWLLLFPVFLRGNEVYAPAAALARPIAAWVMWILTWDVHALSTPGLALFDANAFHPAPAALSLADPLLGLLPLFAPVYAVSGNPVLAYQFALLATLALCGAGLYALARHWGASVPAAALAGTVYMLCPARLGVLAEFMYVSGQYLPLALICADRLSERPRLRDAVMLLLFASWQVLCGIKMGYAASIAVAVFLVCRVVARPGRWRGVALSTVSMLGVAAVLVLLTAPYRSQVAAGLFPGGAIGEMAAFSSADAWRAYLVPPYVARFGWTLAGGGLYAGLFPLALAVVGAIAVGRARFDLLAIGVVSYGLSLGPDVFGGVAPYRVAAAVLPGFAAHGPEPLRFALVGMLAIAVLVGFGADAVQQIVRRAAPRLRWPVVALMLLGVLIDYRVPFQGLATQRVLHSGAELPVYAALAELPSGPLLELPMDPCPETKYGAVIERQLASRLHWNPLLDGHREFDRAPVTHPIVRAIANALPDERAVRLLRRSTGLRYVVVHLTEAPGDWRRRWRHVAGLTRLGFHGHDLLFEVAAEVDADPRADLLSLPRADRTLTGVAVAPLAEAQRSAAFRYVTAPARSAAAEGWLRAEVLIENRSDVAWPVLTTDVERRVHVSYLWSDSAGALAGGDPRAQLLPFDLAPGESVAVQVCVRAPSSVGDFHLALGLTQGEQWFPDFSEKVQIRVAPP